MNLRIGHGYDIHRTAPGRPMVLGGVTFECDVGLDGHSDADCLTHAVCDALLGAAGRHALVYFYPNTVPAIKDFASQNLHVPVRVELAARGWSLVNIDPSLIAEKPKIQPRLAEKKAV